MEEKIFITLRCNKCENISCHVCPNGTYVPETSLRGCTRGLTEDEYAKYIFYTEEVYNHKAYYREIIDFLEHVYSLPLGQVLDKRGKIKSYQMGRFI